MKIGLYGGTFDPPHNAHLNLAEWVKNELHLEYIYFIPASIHACKNNINLSPALQRQELVEKAIEGYKGFRVSRIEIERKDTSYTVDTLKQFKQYENLPDCELFYIIGIDNLIEFHRWKEPDVILKLVNVVVMRRSLNDPHSLKNDFAQNVTYLDSPIIDISATEIRNKIRLGVDVSGLIAPAVLKVINENGLYRD